MKKLKIACSSEVRDFFSTDRKIIDIHTAEFEDISAAVVTEQDRDMIDAIYKTMFGIPVFVISDETERAPEALKDRIYRWVYTKMA